MMTLENKPTYSSHRIYKRSMGPYVSAFSKTFLTASRGFRQNDALELTLWQKRLMRDLFEINDKGVWRHNKAVIGIPRKNGKSMTASVIVLYSLLFGGRGVEIYSAAVDRGQAKIIFKEVADQIANNTVLKKRLKVTRDQILNVKTGAIYKPLSADASSAQGKAPKIVVLDEVGEWKGEKAKALLSALSEGSGDRSEYMVICISTAGYNPDSILGELYKHGRRVSLPKDHPEYLDDPYFFFSWWEAPEGCDPMNEENWYLANPNLSEGLMNIEDLRSKLTNPTPFSIASFCRYRLNMWVRVAGIEFISREAWKNAYRDDKIKLGSEIVLGFDGSQTGDSTGIVAMDLRSGQMEVMGLWENKTDKHGWYVDKNEVFEKLKEISSKYRIKTLWADPSYFQMDLMRWSKDLRINVVKVPANQMTKWAQRMTSSIIYGEVFHSDDPDLTRHVFNAILREDGSFQKISKQSKEKIDLLVCATLANGAREFSIGKDVTTFKGAQILDL